MSSRTHIIADSSTAQLLMSQSPRRRLLLSLIGRPRAVSELAAETGLSIGKVHYQVTDLHRRGLLKLDSERKRGGRPMRLYCAVAKQFFVPIKLIQGSPGRGLAEELREQLDNEIARGSQEGVMFDLDERGQPRVSSFGARHSHQRAAEFWIMPNLDVADVGALISELAALLDRYERKTSRGNEYLVHAAVVRRR